MAYQQENRFREKVEEKRKKMIDTLFEYIENNPTSWESGWYRMPSESPINGKTQKKYKGMNAFYLSIISAMKGYTDPRWVTYNQAQEMGANVKSGEKSSEVFYWSWYDKKTKKPFDESTLDGMTKDEAQQYRDENVRPVLKFYQVFNANQCHNMPEYVRDNKTPEMELEERAKQVEIIERVIANSAAPVNYDGGNRAYYSPMTDSIHLPEVERFKSMQDFYATALHEIAHSTGHKDRLNREISNGFGSPNYAREELRAELASVFMQVELGISVEGRHFENHGAYLASWLKAVKNNNKEFFAAAADAEKIADYVSENYAQEKKIEEEIATEEPKFEQDKSFEKQVDMTFTGELPSSEAVLVRPETPFCLRLVGFNNLPMLITQKHIKDINHPEEENNSQYHGLSVDIIKGLPKYLENPVMILESISKNNSEKNNNIVIVVTDCIDHKNRPIIVAIQPNGSGKYNSIRIDSNFILSFYGRQNFGKFIENTINQNKILYWDKEKSQKLYRDMQVQFPQGLYNLDSNTIIRKAKAFVNSLEAKSQNNLNVSENTSKKADNSEQAQQVGQAEQDIYGLIYNWKGLKEENSIYTASELAELDEAFVPEERYDGAVAANKTYMVIRLTGKNQEETEQNIRRFLTGEYNKEEVMPHDDWYWETVTENFFTGEQNPTTIDYIKKLQLSESDLVMRSNESISEKVREPYRSYLIEQERNPEAVYFKRIGDFYEVMGENAKIAAEELGLTLTGRDVGLDERVPMCGVPFHAVDKYIDKLREKFDVMKDGENDIEYLSRKEENTKENYILDFKLNYSNEMLLSNELAKLGYKRDDSVFERNQNNDIAATEAGIPYWTNEIKYIGKDGRSIVGLYGRTSNGIIIEATDITRFTLNGIEKSEMEDIVKVLRGFGVYATIEQSEQARQDEQIEKAEQVQQVGQVKKWRNIELSENQIGDERGKSTRINMSKSGEYSSFVFFVPTKFLRKDEKTGAIQLSVNADFNYTLMRGNQRVELTGEELCQAMAGKVIGKRTQRLLSAENAKTLSDLEHNVPEEMRNYPNWCVFTTRWNEQKGKKDKSIYSPTLGVDSEGKMQWASIDKPETWTTFEAALTFAKENDCAGLVFALNGEGISCIDLDKAIVKDGKLNDKPTDKPEGTMSSIAEKLTSEMLDTYIETSASGNGIHIFVKDDILANGKYKNRAETPDGEIEVYDEKRFISMTGNIRSKTVRLGKSPIATTSWLQGKLGEKVLIKNNNVAPPRKGQGIDRSDRALIERIQRSKSAADFNALFNGDNMLGDNSRSDFKLLNILAFFSDCDAMQMERLFKESKLYRPEKGEQYVQRSVRKAIDTLNTRISEKALGSSNVRGNGGGKRGSTK